MVFLMPQDIRTGDGLFVMCRKKVPREGSKNGATDSKKVSKEGQ